MPWAMRLSQPVGGKAVWSREAGRRLTSAKRKGSKTARPRGRHEGEASTFFQAKSRADEPQASMMM
jgi:hypothetical protein